ncbi:MAG: cellulose binding domain-containing protein, partial [Eubacteriales bacterium]
MQIAKKILAMTLILTTIATLILPPRTTLAMEPTNNDKVYYKTFENFDLEFTITSDWGTGYAGQMKIINTGTEPIEGWSLSFDFSHQIDNIWSASIENQEKDNYTIKSLDYNQKIAPGENITFGFTGTPGDIEEPPTNIRMNKPKQKELTNSQYNIDFNISNDWETGHQGSITIDNLTDTAIEDWIIEFDYDYNITSFDNANIIEQTDNHYKITNAGYNSNIEKGQAITIDFQGTPGNITTNPTNYKLYTNTYEEDAPPITIGEIKATNITTTTVDLSWETKTNEEETYYYIIYRDGEEIGRTTTLNYTDVALTPEQSYTYDIQAKSETGQSSNVSTITITTKAEDPTTQPPTAPTNIEAIQITTEEITLGWEESTSEIGIKTYIIYRDEEEIGRTEKTTYTDTGLEEGKTYTYEIQAKDTKENTSEKTKIKTTTEENLPPEPPTHIIATKITMNEITLEWQEPSQNHNQEKKYIIYRDGEEIGKTEETTYTDTELEKETAYTYEIKTTNQKGETSEGITETIKTKGDTEAPTTPEITTIEKTMNTITIEWNKSTDNVELDYYAIYRDGEQIATTGERTYTDTDLKDGTTYTYTITAVDTSKNETTKTNTEDITTEKDTEAPTTPELKEIQITETKTIELSWDESTDNQEVKHYNIYRNEELLTTTTKTTYTDNTPQTNTTYTYEITAEDISENESDKSRPQTIIIDTKA